jgi:ABC-type proline/glycine betaine transport system permease subunit
MNTHLSPSSERVWAMIEREKRRERFLRRVSVGAWSVTGGAVTIFGVATGLEVWRTARHAMAGLVTWSAVFETAMPVVAVVGILGLLLAIGSTAGIFLRLRTASLSEIQMRLAALEEMVASHLDLDAD